LEEDITNPHLNGDASWPFVMGVLSVLKVLHGEQSQIETWLQMGRSVPDEKFKKALTEHLPGIVIESFGRLLSCKKRNNDNDWYCAILEVLFEIRDALCFLNKGWVTHDYYQGLMDTFEFPLLPKEYREIVPRLWHVKDIDDAIVYAKELVCNFNTLLSEHGIHPVVYTDSRDIPL
jgi:kanamycin nucleotidyltransferase